MEWNGDVSAAISEEDGSEIPTLVMSDGTGFELYSDGVSVTGLPILMTWEHLKKMFLDLQNLTLASSSHKA